MPRQADRAEEAVWLCAKCMMRQPYYHIARFQSCYHWAHEHCLGDDKWCTLCGVGSLLQAKVFVPCGATVNIYGVSHVFQEAIVQYMEPVLRACDPSVDALQASIDRYNELANEIMDVGYHLMDMLETTTDSIDIVHAGADPDWFGERWISIYKAYWEADEATPGQPNDELYEAACRFLKQYVERVAEVADLAQLKIKLDILRVYRETVGTLLQKLLRDCYWGFWATYSSDVSLTSATNMVNLSAEPDNANITPFYDMFYAKEFKSALLKSRPGESPLLDEATAAKCAIYSQRIQPFLPAMMELKRQMRQFGVGLGGILLDQVFFQEVLLLGLRDILLLLPAGNARNCGNNLATRQGFRLEYQEGETQEDNKYVPPAAVPLCLLTAQHCDLVVNYARTLVEFYASDRRPERLRVTGAESRAADWVAVPNEGMGVCFYFALWQWLLAQERIDVCAAGFGCRPLRDEGEDMGDGISYQGPAVRNPIPFVQRMIDAIVSRIDTKVANDVEARRHWALRRLGWLAERAHWGHWSEEDGDEFLVDGNRWLDVACAFNVTVFMYVPKEVGSVVPAMRSRWHVSTPNPCMTDSVNLWHAYPDTFDLPTRWLHNCLFVRAGPQHYELLWHKRLPPLSFWYRVIPENERSTLQGRVAAEIHPYSTLTTRADGGFLEFRGKRGLKRIQGAATQGTKKPQPAGPDALVLASSGDRTFWSVYTPDCRAGDVFCAFLRWLGHRDVPKERAAEVVLADMVRQADRYRGMPQSARHMPELLRRAWRGGDETPPESTIWSLIACVYGVRVLWCVREQWYYSVLPLCTDGTAQTLWYNTLRDVPRGSWAYCVFLQHTPDDGAAIRWQLLQPRSGVAPSFAVHWGADETVYRLRERRRDWPSP